MANYMFILRPMEKNYKCVCTACAKCGIVEESCNICNGTGVYHKRTTQYYVQDRPVYIESVDRDPKTGILRYWENSCEFFYETIYPELNKYVPNVPHGIHLCHDDKASANTECARINNYLKKELKAR